MTANAIIDINRDSAKREKNIIIFGIDESNSSTPSARYQEDKEKVEKVLEKLDIDNEKVRRIFRLKTTKLK